jgi:hypothetical protein
MPIWQTCGYTKTFLPTSASQSDQDVWNAGALPHLDFSTARGTKLCALAQIFLPSSGVFTTTACEPRGSTSGVCGM